MLGAVRLSFDSFLKSTVNKRKCGIIHMKDSRYGNNSKRKKYSNNTNKNNQNNQKKSSSVNNSKSKPKVKKDFNKPKTTADNSSLSQNSQYIQWFPGHMTRTKRQIQSDLKLVDAAAEIIDARVPFSSRNPDLSALLGNKPRIILMNKCDLADPKATKQWISYFKEQGVRAVELDCKTGKGINLFAAAVRDVLGEQIAKWESKGMKNHSLKVMIVGIPNVGKSSFINRISKSTKAKVEDRPGVTRGNQWFTLDKNIELLDTPGVLWPRFDDQLVGERLAFTGAVKDQIMDTEQLALRLLEYFKENPNAVFLERFNVAGEEVVSLLPHELLSLIAKKRGMLIAGGEADTERAAVMVLDEFRAAKLGRITLELPNQKRLNGDE